MSAMTSKIAGDLGGDHVVEVAGEGAGEPQDGVVLLPRVAQVLDQSEVSTAALGQSQLTWIWPSSSASTVLFVLPSRSYSDCRLHL